MSHPAESVTERWMDYYDALAAILATPHGQRDNRYADEGEPDHPRVASDGRGLAGPAVGSPLRSKSILKKAIKDAELEARERTAEERIRHLIEEIIHPQDLMLGAKQHPRHRPRLYEESGLNLPFPAMVTRIVSRAEVRRNKKAQEVVAKEWSGLRNRKVWIEANRRAKRDVIADAKQSGEEVQFSALYVIIGEKGSELPVGDPR